HLCAREGKASLIGDPVSEVGLARADPFLARHQPHRRPANLLIKALWRLLVACAKQRRVMRSPTLHDTVDIRVWDGFVASEFFIRVLYGRRFAWPQPDAHGERAYRVCIGLEHPSSIDHLMLPSVLVAADNQVRTSRAQSRKYRFVFV